ncbi:MAG TPA: DHA2 family efflux MFS transporter permease subunit [Caulobacteraceae bacterium]|nr:DHA2 family efflux MFS transporter permease subunit [Caulobacteraceae bacterium]
MPSDTQDSAAPRLSAWPGFAVMGVGMFMAILDIQVVATSIPNIQKALSVRPEQISWIQTAYLIAEVIAIPLTGLLTRLLSMRWLFVAAIAAFTAASLGCASSGSFAALVTWRVLQGFAGGTLIPAVFSAVFLLFPTSRQALATTIAGVLAVLAPTVGPVVGGWITQTFSWHWLFLINIAPGVLCAIGGVALLPVESPRWPESRRLDLASLAAMAVALAALEIALKQAPERGWGSAAVLGLFAVSLAAGGAFVRRTLRRAHPVVELRTLARPEFAVGCLLSFVLGVGLFGSTYLMPVFLAFVRGHNALEIGEIMLVTGVAQLLTAPVAVALERRLDPRVLTGFGFLLFALGLGLSVFGTPDTDFRGMFWPQVVRGVAIMFCLLPPTRLALGALALEQVPDASGLFNLMRNLGGAIGIALIDTVIYGRAPVIGRAIARRLQAGDIATAKAVGIPLDLFRAQGRGPVDADTAAILKPMIDHLALARAIDEAWLLMAVLTALAILSLPFTRSNKPPNV